MLLNMLGQQKEHERFGMGAVTTSWWLATRPAACSWWIASTACSSAVEGVKAAPAAIMAVPAAIVSAPSAIAGSVRATAGKTHEVVMQRPAAFVAATCSSATEGIKAAPAAVCLLNPSINAAPNGMLQNRALKWTLRRD